ncbi:bifunctional diaminohydroxyphosphoribosylaminopyrimidine deaminase/5-amino-6-(5-phosphoribosylamino)uracil reductase RibD [bacterium]|nr:bifunctional diaminohydroxyphosphoribosylaminopyrimidine deaminase/5-amino-6-(5-phosphoribosylamino)uracil reductase RibD [bacterium]
MAEHEYSEYMRRAIELARRSFGRTRPNPNVGALIIKNGEIVGEGWHHQAGQAHAEVEALRSCSVDPRGATMVVTLEPCNHTGRTGPCSEAVLRAGISRLVIAQLDPNVVSGGGIERLRAAGVEVITGVEEGLSMQMNPAFNTFHMLGRPFVTMKWAVSADGCTSCESGHSFWITGESARRHVHEMRALHDATLVGVETALRDKARLSIRGIEIPPGPPRRRMVLDSRLQVPVDHPLVTETQGIATVVCSEDAPADREEALANAGAEVWRLESDNNGHVSLPALMARFREEGVQSVFVEGGRHVAGAFVANGFVDRVAAFMAPVLIGAAQSPLNALVMPQAPDSMEQAIRLHHVRTEAFGDDVLLEGWVTRHLFPEEQP